MSNAATYPYSLDIIPLKTQGGSYQWAIRMQGRLVQSFD